MVRRTTEVRHHSTEKGASQSQRRVIDWLPLALAVVGFAVAWYARNAMSGDVGSRALLIGAGKAVGYLGLAFFLFNVVRRD